MAKLMEQPLILTHRYVLAAKSGYETGIMVFNAVGLSDSTFYRLLYPFGSQSVQLATNHEPYGHSINPWENIVYNAKDNPEIGGLINSFVSFCKTNIVRADSEFIPHLHKTPVCAIPFDESIPDVISHFIPYDGVKEVEPRLKSVLISDCFCDTGLISSTEFNDLYDIKEDILATVLYPNFTPSYEYNTDRTQLKVNEKTCPYPFNAMGKSIIQYHKDRAIKISDLTFFNGQDQFDQIKGIERVVNYNIYKHRGKKRVHSDVEYVQIQEFVLANILKIRSVVNSKYQLSHDRTHIIYGESRSDDLSRGVYPLFALVLKYLSYNIRLGSDLIRRTNLKLCPAALCLSNDGELFTSFINCCVPVVRDNNHMEMLIANNGLPLVIPPSDLITKVYGAVFGKLLTIKCPLSGFKTKSTHPSDTYASTDYKPKDVFLKAAWENSGSKNHHGLAYCEPGIYYEPGNSGIIRYFDASSFFASLMENIIPDDTLMAVFIQNMKKAKNSATSAGMRALAKACLLSLYGTSKHYNIGLYEEVGRLANVCGVKMMECVSQDHNCEIIRVMKDSIMFTDCGIRGGSNYKTNGYWCAELADSLELKGISFKSEGVFDLAILFNQNKGILVSGNEIRTFGLSSKYPACVNIAVMGVIQLIVNGIKSSHENYSLLADATAMSDIICDSVLNSSNNLDFNNYETFQRYIVPAISKKYRPLSLTDARNYPVDKMWEGDSIPLCFGVDRTILIVKKGTFDRWAYSSYNMVDNFHYNVCKNISQPQNIGAEKVETLIKDIICDREYKYGCVAYDTILHGSELDFPGYIMIAFKVLEQMILDLASFLMEEPTKITSAICRGINQRLTDFYQNTGGVSQAVDVLWLSKHIHLEDQEDSDK